MHITMHVIRRGRFCFLAAVVAIVAILIGGSMYRRSHGVFKICSVAALGLFAIFLVVGLRTRAHAVARVSVFLPSNGTGKHRVWPIQSTNLDHTFIGKWQEPTLPHGCRIRFNPRVSCAYVRDLTELSVEHKSMFWWQQEDFDDFLQVRVEIGKAYRAAAKKLGLDIMQVMSVGSHGDEGYRAMIQSNPKLAGESRRGLGLGRKRQRARNRDAYIVAVISEQRRQQRTCEASAVPYVLDSGALAEAARRVSEKDLRYAHFLAKIYYEQDRAVEANEAASSEGDDEACSMASCGVASVAVADTPSGGGGGRMSPQLDALGAPPLGSSRSGISHRPETPLHDSPLAGASFCLNDEEAVSVSGGLERKVSPSFSSKGFGLSREKLRMFGLSATGHSISRYQRLRHLQAHGGGSEDDHAESDVTAGETEDDGLGGNAEFIAQYRSWRMGAPVRAGLPGHSDVKTYGTRKEYRAWRTWQRPPADGAIV